jgi:hypothetical protein
MVVYFQWLCHDWLAHNRYWTHFKIVAEAFFFSSSDITQKKKAGYKSFDHQDQHNSLILFFSIKSKLMDSLDYA